MRVLYLQFQQNGLHILRLLKKTNFFLEDLKKKLKDEVVIYNPRVKVEKFHKKKIISKEFNILGDYILCFNPKFENQKILRELQFTKGLKYFLKGFYTSQQELKELLESKTRKILSFVLDGSPSDSTSSNFLMKYCSFDVITGYYIYCIKYL